MKEYCSLTLASLCEELAKPKKTLIFFHARPDADAIGSAFALKLMLEEMGSEAYCLCENEIPERLEFLTKGLQSSVLRSSLPKSFEFERTISIDTASPSQMGDLFPEFEGRVDIMIDHHAKGTPYADNYIKPECSASGEILFEIANELISLGKIKELNKKMCELLYAAISSDTGCFKYSNVTPNTHICASELVKTGIDSADINHKLFECKSVKVLSAEAEGFRSIKFFADGKISAVIFPYELKERLGLLDEHLETLVDIARSVEGAQVAFAVRQPTEKKQFRVSARSMCDVDVSLACATFGGGGHIKAAGCTISASSAEYAATLFANEIEKQLKN